MAVEKYVRTAKIFDIKNAMAAPDFPMKPPYM